MSQSTSHNVTRFYPTTIPPMLISLIEEAVATGEQIEKEILPNGTTSYRIGNLKLKEGLCTNCNVCKWKNAKNKAEHALKNINYQFPGSTNLETPSSPHQFLEKDFSKHNSSAEAEHPLSSNSNTLQINGTTSPDATGIGTDNMRSNKRKDDGDGETGSEVEHKKNQSDEKTPNKKQRHKEKEARRKLRLERTEQESKAKLACKCEYPTTNTNGPLPLKEIDNNKATNRTAEARAFARELIRLMPEEDQPYISESEIITVDQPVQIPSPISTRTASKVAAPEVTLSSDSEPEILFVSATPSRSRKDPSASNTSVQTKHEPNY